ncbi:MAG: DUF1957 domain-containing protein, partial [Myxococcales bacterium]|nr:DUF1957 domain-containing protein [Myxococcales bacterium]
MAAPDGHLVLFLHAHLPFVRHPEHEDFLEEDWLYEAITETYLPLILAARGWAQDGLRARLGISSSPALVSMLQDSLLMGRYRRRLGKLVDVARAQARVRAPGDPLAGPARAAADQLERLAHAFEAELGGDLVAALASLEAAGALEPATCVATHAFLPFYAVDRADARGHVKVAVRAHRATFGRNPPGVWLPECGYVPGLDQLLADEGLCYFFVDSHGALLADPPAALGVHAPLVCKSGVLAFPRDPEASRAVWSAEAGYPGDPRYREFYRDQGFELPEAELQSLLLPTGERRGIGLKYHRITGREVALGDKAPYDPAAAAEAVHAHATHFVAARRAQAAAFAARHQRPAVITVPFDAELFGHWWFEGPAFLDAVVRAAAATEDLRVSSPAQVIQEAGPFQLSTPAASSWGRAGYGEVWLNEENDWIWPPLHKAARRMRIL